MPLALCGVAAIDGEAAPGALDENAVTGYFADGSMLRGLSDRGQDIAEEDDR